MRYGCKERRKGMQSIFRYIVKFVKKYNADDVGAYAGQASLFIIMSFLPFVLMVFNILNLIPGVAQSDVVTMVTGLFPDVFQKSLPFGSLITNDQFLIIAFVEPESLI